MEIWKDVPGFEGAYQVSDQGRVRSLDREVRFVDGRVAKVRGRVLKPSKAAKKYDVVRLPNLRVLYVHRLVLETFLGVDPARPVARHRDNNPANNKLANLRWGTNSDNQMDRVPHGTSNRGEAHGQAKLSAAQVIAIRASTLTTRELAGVYGVSRRQVRAVRTGRAWAHV